jgi:GNAT superfamily N-acetyltransferase
MADPFDVVHTEINDLEFVYGLFEQSIFYQEKNGYPVWRNYDQDAIRTDIENKNHFKITSGNKIGIVFSVCYTDKVIWRHYETGDAVYLHRIVVNPEYKGQQLFGKILDWAIQHGKQKSLKAIRMDTWAANPKIIAYYKTFGFNVIENYTTPDSLLLPVHNRNLALTLLEYPLNN